MARDFRNDYLEQAFNEWWNIFGRMNLEQVQLSDDPNDLLTLASRLAFEAGADAQASKVLECIELYQRSECRERVR